MTRFAVSIVSPDGYVHSGAFREVGETLHHALRALGHDSVLTGDCAPTGRRPIVLGSNLLPSTRQPLAEDAILYNLEQVEAGSTWITPELVNLFRRHEVWDYSERNAARYGALGLPRPRVVPIGYVPELTRIVAAPEEDIDVLFYGCVNPRRQAILDALRARGLRVEAPFGVYGAARDQLIARAKVVLNVHYYEAKVFEIVRVSYLLANGRCVVSERGADPEEERPFEPGVAFAPYQGLVDACVALARDPAARAAKARAGQAILVSRPAAAFVLAALEGRPPETLPATPPERSAVPMTPPLSMEDVLSMTQPSGKRILDVACSDGEVGAALLAAGAAEVVGLDPCARGLTRSRLSAVFQLDPDAEHDLPYPDGYFDVVLVEDLSRMLVPVATLQHLRRWLADGGRLVCVAPNATHEAAIAAVLSEGRLPANAGIRPMSVGAALEALECAGFKVEDEVVLVRTDPGPSAPAIGALAASLGVDPARAADNLTLVRAIVGARPAEARGAHAEPIPDPWRGSRKVKVLIAPDLADPRDEWIEATQTFARGLSRSPDVTIGIALPLPLLSAPPDGLKQAAEACEASGLDMLLTEAPVDDGGWERLLAGATMWVATSEHRQVQTARIRTGTPIQRV